MLFRSHVLYLEGSTDLAVLRALADRLNHPVRDLIADGAHLNVYYLQDNQPESGQTPDELLDAVEGSFGQRAKAHFSALRRILPDLRALEIIDNDNRGLVETSEEGFTRLPWRRYELENYIITPRILLDWAQPESFDLFDDQRAAILDALIFEKIFEGNAADYSNYSAANPATQSTIWRAQTQTKKLSVFAEEFFRRVADATGTPMLLRKRDLYRLVELQDPGAIDPEVSSKLGAIQQLLQPQSTD